MHLLLLESGRKFLQTAECAALSILAHGLLIWSALSLNVDGWRIPVTEREARVFFLLPPDRVDVRDRQSEVFQLGKLGGGPQDGGFLLNPDPGLERQRIARGSRGKLKGSGARGQLPFGPASPYVPDTAFSVLQVDETVERYESSAAPIYPKDLLATGTQGDVEATYVVDTAGQVDTTTVHVMSSDDPRFTASVMTALGGMRFRPAKRSGHVVRQLVQQMFRFRIMPAADLSQSGS
jgi:TonB family protein